jgi:hypothetical protein
MFPDAPHHRYFRAKEGRWRGKIRFELTDPRGLRGSSLSLRDRWSLRSLSLASRLSVLTLTTTVDYTGRGQRNEVLHTTRVSNLGVPVYRSEETIFLEDDGRTLRIEGREAFFPFLRSAGWVGGGAVATDHDGAAYRIPCFGLTMGQENVLRYPSIVFSRASESTTFSSAPAAPQARTPRPAVSSIRRSISFSGRATPSMTGRPLRDKALAAARAEREEKALEKESDGSRFAGIIRREGDVKPRRKGKPR